MTNDKCLRITFVNHATVLIQLGGINIITDPIYSRTISYFLPRLKSPGIPFEELPKIDVVLISHNHYDHLNLKTLRRLYKNFQPDIILPNGVAKYGKRTGYQSISEMKWWEEASFDSLKVTCVPAKHFSGRKPWDRNKSVFCGYIIQANGFTVYFAGDSGYSELFKKIGERFEIDVALLPIGAYRPRAWFKNIHMNPYEAVQAYLDVKAKHLIPIHWGTFKISDEPMSEPPILLRQAAEEHGVMELVHILENGETFCWSNGILD
ncbi:MAG: MBL fold metallo-hydrolase [Bacteroidetes bacterium]|nr:MAG: MBL fold metallo-hydrolase [Bacteroidota bacterium]